MASSDNLTPTGIYSEAFKEYGESPKALHWTSYRSQAVRFKVLVDDLNIEGKTILDAGCGLGDVIPYLYAKSLDFSYLGVDQSQAFITVAKKRYEGENFMVLNPFEKPAGKFDIVISSGVMNADISDWLNIRKLMITVLFEQSKEVLAFNMAGSYHPPPPSRKIAYANAQEILDFCKSMTSKVRIKTGYLPKDFTVLMHK